MLEYVKYNKHLEFKFLKGELNVKGFMIQIKLEMLMRDHLS